MCPHYQVFICHRGADTKKTVVDTLYGRLVSKGITCFVDYKMKAGSEISSSIKGAIKASRVHIIFLSPHFANSTWCLNEVVEIMNVCALDNTTCTRRKVLPIFYDVEPAVVRHQPAGSAYDLSEVKRSTPEERERWAQSLKNLSLIKGFEYNTRTMYEWDIIEEIAGEVEAFLTDIILPNKEPKYEKLYAKELDEVRKVVKSEEFKHEDVFLIGVHCPSTCQFAELLVKTFSSDFNAWCILCNVVRKGSQRDGSSNLIQNVYSALMKEPNEPLSETDIRKRKHFLEERLQNMRCLIVLDDIGNDAQQIMPFFEQMKEKLRKRSIVVVTSRFEYTLLNVVKVDKLISLSSVEDNREILIICHGDRSDIHEAFINHLKETFSMLGVDVHLLGKDKVIREITSLQDAQVILCIISKSFRMSDCDEMFTNAAINNAKILYALYGPHYTNESISKTCFNLNADFKGTEGQLDKRQFKIMVEEVMRNLSTGHQKIIDITDFPVSLAQRVNEIVSRISRDASRSDRSFQCFGLLGMGGVGKTTIAMSVYNRVYKDFEGAFFCLNTRANASTNNSGLIHLQKKILDSLTSSQYADEKINDEVHGKTLLSSKLTGLNAFIVLDDVDTMAQLDALYVPLFSLGSKSIVIITSRYRRILESAQPAEIFVIKGFSNKEDSQRLFYWHAFLKPEPPEQLSKVSEKIIDACQGLPLSLKVLGAHLYDKTDKCYWYESLSYLQQNEKDIFNVLRISLDGLESNQREAFLDICSFFIGEEEGIAYVYLDACYGIGRTHLDMLQSRCLITIDNEGRIGMHDQLRDMGRYIIRQELRDRAWDDETAINILKDQRGCSALRGLLIRSDMSFTKSVVNCESLPELRILLVKDETLDVERSSQRRGVTLQQLPCGFQIILHFLDGMIGCFPWIRYFNDDVLGEELLQNVHCYGLRLLVWNYALFHQLPRGLCSPNIRVLQLCFSNIIKVPTALLPNLQFLDVSGCKGLKGFDSSIGRLTNLRHLDLSWCDRIARLPKEMIYLSSLKLLILNHCTSLRTLSFLPENLQTLTLEMKRDRPGSLETMEASLPNLQELDLSYQPKLKRLKLIAASIRRLKLERCEKLEELDCKDLSSLQELDLSSCNSLKKLSFLSATLEELDLSFCYEVELVDVGTLTNLRKLDIRKCCHLLKNLPEGVENLPSLKIITHNYAYLRSYEMSCSKSHSFK